MQGDDLTGEISGIFSNTFADGKFGIALSGSYQERDFGYNEASVSGGWYAFPGGEGPLANAEPAANATNPPGPGRSAERRIGKEGVSRCGSRGAPSNKQKK